MNPADREKEIFEQAIDLPSAEARLAYARGACGNDAGLLARLETLLRAHEATGNFLPEKPGMVSALKLALAAATEKPGTVIGRYKLLENIGEGGFGTVYMAEQSEPIRRRVALKVIKLGMDTREVVTRFEAERQALAMMEHPNIAKVLDGGATDTGRPYFVMELVKGVPLTTYCDQRQLSTPARLGLFILVCQAVQHAHQKGIIHRDLKPSNILVTEQDDRPVPKIIDFGVARATQARLTEKTMFTQFHQLIGTPAYMSPEQTGLANLDIDTRSDIYSLGVLLYELLTGQTPFDAKKLHEAGYEGIMRIIREVEPPKPSTRLSSLSLQELTALGGRRHEEPRRLGRLLQGDLDWIVMKALEKDRTRRYETAASLAQDLQRHLGNEPVVARPPSPAYRFQKMVRRNRLAVAAAAAVSLALVAGLVVSTWSYFKEKAAHEFAVNVAEDQRRSNEAFQTARGDIADVRRQAEASEKQAKIEAARSAQALLLLKALLPPASAGATPAPAPAAWPRALNEAADQLVANASMPPEAKAGLCELLGDTAMGSGEFARAEVLYRELLALRRKSLGLLHTDTRAALDKLLDALQRQGKAAEAETERNEAQAGRLKFLKTNSFPGINLVYYARELRQQGRYAEADAAYWEAIAIYQSVRKNGDNAARMYWLGDIAAMRFEAGDFAGARELAGQWLQAEIEFRSWSMAVATSFGTVNHQVIFNAHSLLGRIDLQEGHKVEAKHHLLQAARLRGVRSYALVHGRMDFTLAAELLIAGEREVVLQFLDLIRDYYVTGWATGANHRRGDNLYEAEALGRAHAGNWAQWRNEVSAGRVPEEWRKRQRPPPLAAPVLTLPPLPRPDQPALVRQLGRLANQLEYPLCAQMLGWMMLTPLVWRRPVADGDLPRRAAGWLLTFGGLCLVQGLLVLAIKAGANFRYPALKTLVDFWPVAGWAALWEFTRALRGETVATRPTIAVRLLLVGLLPSLVQNVLKEYHYLQAMHSDLFFFVLMVLSISIPAVVGITATRELLQWTRRHASAGRQTLWLFLAVPILGLQAVTSPWIVPSLMHDSVNPILGSGILWLNVLLPLLLLAGLVVRPKPTTSTAPVACPPPL